MSEEYDEAIEEDVVSFLNNQQNNVMTHLSINHNFSGEVVSVSEGYAKVVLETSEVMRADDLGLVHGGFIFSGADYAAMVAVNEPNVVLASCNCLFLSPVRVKDIVVFEAFEHQKEGRKRNVTVKGYVLDIKVFEGEFKTVITERHVLRLDLLKNIEESGRPS